MADRPGPPRLTRAQAVAGASQQSAERGEEYVAVGAVLSAVRQGLLLRGKVEGNSEEYYDVTVVLDAQGVKRVDCTCPYDWGGHCKHIVALLLTWVDAPESFVEQAPIEDLVGGLDAEAARDLLARAAETWPDFDAWLRERLPGRHVGRSRESASEPGTVSRAAWDTKVRKVLSGTRGVGHYSDAPERLAPVLDKAEHLLRGGDAVGALRILLAIAAPLALQYEDYEGEYEVGEFVEWQLVPLIVETLADADLSEDERTAVAAELRSFDAALEDYNQSPYSTALEAVSGGQPTA